MKLSPGRVDSHLLMKLQRPHPRGCLSQDGCAVLSAEYKAAKCNSDMGNYPAILKVQGELA